MKKFDACDVLFILLNFADYITNILVVIEYGRYQQQQLYNILILTMLVVQIIHCCVAFFLNISEASNYSICQVVAFLAIFFPFPPLTKCIPYIVTTMNHMHYNDEYIDQHRLVFWMQCCVEGFATSIVQAIGIAMINDNNNMILIISLLISMTNVWITTIPIGYYYLPKHILGSMKILLTVCVIIDYFGMLSTLLLLFDNPSIKNFNTYVCLSLYDM